MSEPEVVELEIYWSRLIAIVDEAAAVLLRTSFSDVVREAHDFACMLMDVSGESVANSTVSIPVFLGSGSRTMGHFLQRYAVDEWHDGDIAITNDPWLATGHLRDVTLARPVFIDGQIVAFALATAQLPDIGGTVWSADAQEVFEEGLRVPVMKLSESGNLNTSLLDIIRANVRVPDQVEGDLFAMMSSIEIMAQGLHNLVSESRDRDFGRMASVIKARSEEKMRAAIREIPDGDYRSEVTGDGFEDGFRIRCRIRIDEDKLDVSYEDSSPQSTRAINSVLYHTFSYTAGPLKSLLDPLTPNNEGALRPITVSAPEGSLLNARFPAAVDARSLVSHYIHAAIFSAMEEVLPEAVIGHCGGPGIRAVFSGIEQGVPFSTSVFAFGGMGGTSDSDGLNSTSYPTIASNPPIEILERSAPIMITEKSIISDSGGAGCHRGGTSHRIRVLALHTGRMECSLMAERTRNPPKGVLGGAAGTPTEIYLNDHEAIDPKGRNVMRTGDLLTLVCPGGGGYGKPSTRPVLAVARDVVEGYVSKAAAIESYGVAEERLTASIRSLTL